ncbi:MAG: InlB B-repeat-containing protein [Aristaeellaceae bacterium]
MKNKLWMVLLLTLVLAMACTCALAEATTYTVTFDTNAPEGVTVTGAPTEQTVESGNTVKQPADPAAEGYQFDGWYSDEALANEYDFTAAVTGDITLIAKWTQIQCTVTFDLQDSTLTAIEPQTVNYGGKVSKPEDPTREGYAFGGWYKEPTCANAFDFETPVTSDITLYARWDIVRYAVTFDNNGHGVKPTDQQVNHGSTATNPGNLVEQGWQFDGWFAADAGEAYDFSTPVTADVALTARWTALHKVSFNLNGHGAVIKPVTVADGGTVAAPAAPAASGYAFTGWYTDSDCSAEYDFGTAVNSDLTLYAGWTATVTVRFQWKTAITHAGDAPSDSAQIALVVNGQEQNDLQTVAPDSEASWTNLPASDVYSVVAKNVPENYTAVVTRIAENSYLVTYVEDDKLTVTITNTHVADTIDMVISKFWDDNNSQHRPAEIKVQVKKSVNGTVENVGEVITLNEGNQWTAHVTDLYMRESGQTIQYTIEEVSEVMGYTTTCEITVDAQGNYTVKITNVLTGKVDIAGTKVWEDDDNRDGLRPDSVQLKIYENAIADANLVKIVIVTAGDSTGNVWSWSVEDLPVYDKFGRPITYIVVEDPVPEGYTASAPQYVTVGTMEGDPTE